MDPAEALNTSVQVAVTLAGFAGVVVAFRDRSVHEWSKVDKFRLQILLTNSATPFALSILALVLLAAQISSPLIWRLCSLFTFVLQVLIAASYGSAFRRFSTDEFRASGGKRWIMYSGSVVAFAVTMLQLYNVIRLQTFWPFFVSVASLLLFAMLQFILLVFAGQEQSHRS